MPVLHQRVDKTYYVRAVFGVAADNRTGVRKKIIRTYQVGEDALSVLRQHGILRQRAKIPTWLFNELRDQQLVWIKGHRPIQKVITNIRSESIWAALDRPCRVRMGQEAGVPMTLKLVVEPESWRLRLFVEHIERSLPPGLRQASHVSRTLQVRIDCHGERRVLSAVPSRRPATVAFDVPPCQHDYKVTLLTLSTERGTAHGETVTTPGLNGTGTTFDADGNRVAAGTVLAWNRPYYLLIHRSKSSRPHRAFRLRRRVLREYQPQQGWSLLLVEFSGANQWQARRHRVTARESVTNRGS